MGIQPLIFALLINVSNITELEIKINNELSRVSQWMNKNSLTINPSKSQAIIILPLLSQVVSPSNINIKLNSSIIAISDSINYLGVLIDSKLLFHDHIHKIRSKLSHAVGILCKLKNLFPSCILKKTLLCFFSFTLTILSYNMECYIRNLSQTIKKIAK